MTTYDPIERVRRARRQAAMVAALAALVGVLVLAGVAKLWTAWSGATPADRATGAIADDGGPDLRWRPFRPGQDLPESRSAGPTRHLNGRAAGFARSELGAALAVIHIGHRIFPNVGSAVFDPTIQEQVIGADAHRLRELVSSAYERARQDQGKSMGEPLDETGSARLVAYQIESYSPDEATVSMFTAYQDRSELFSFRFDARWVDDDWRLVAPAGGDPTAVRTQIPDLPTGAVALSRGT